jgi:hypothetical protein
VDKRDNIGHGLQLAFGEYGYSDNEEESAGVGVKILGFIGTGKSTKFRAEAYFLRGTKQKSPPQSRELFSKKL